MRATAHVAEPDVAPEGPGSCSAAECHDNSWIDELHLRIEPAPTTRHLGARWRSVTGRPTFENVRDGDVGARDTGSSKQLVKQSAGTTHERPTTHVFICTGGFADEEQRRTNSEVTDDDVRALRGELGAERAPACRDGERGELGHAVVSIRASMLRATRLHNVRRCRLTSDGRSSMTM